MPYLLPYGKKYTNEFIISLESDLNACDRQNSLFGFEINSKKNNFEEISQTEINNLESESINWIIENFNSKRKLRIELLNSHRSREIEYEIIDIENKINNYLDEFLSKYKLNIKPKQIKFSSITKLFSKFQNKNPLKKCKCLWQIKELIMKDSGMGISCEMHDFESFYLQESDLIFWQSIIEDYQNKIFTQASRRRNLVNEYMEIFGCLSKDPRDDNYLDLNLNKLGNRKINKSQLSTIKEIFLVNENKRIENELKNQIEKFKINRIKMAVNRDKLVMGGDTILYYLRLIYPGREKPLYKIGITRRSVEERYPGEEFKKINKVLFSEFILEAKEIESDIKKIYSIHALPAAIFKDNSGKTEFFDVDILGIDDMDFSSGNLERPPQKLDNQ
jgi:hypothetical protein